MFRIVNWRAYQGYQKRGPKWVKLHVSLLRNKAWPKMSLLARATLPALWIIASEQSQDGTFDDDTESLAHLVSMREDDILKAIVELKLFGFIDSDKSVADLASGVSHQTEREESRDRGEERHTAAPLSRVPGTSTALSVEDVEKIDALDESIAFEERRFTELALPLRDSIQSVLDSLPRPASRAPFSASHWLRTGLTGISRKESALTALRLTCDALEARQRGLGVAYENPKRKTAFEAIDRVLSGGASDGSAFKAIGGKQ